MLPRTLSNHPLNPHFDKDALLRVDKVYVDGVLLPNCCYYSKDKHEARAMDAKRNWLPMQHGEITVTEKRAVGMVPELAAPFQGNKLAKYGDAYQENAAIMYDEASDLPPGAFDLFKEAGRQQITDEVRDVTGLDRLTK